MSDVSIICYESAPGIAIPHHLLASGPFSGKHDHLTIHKPNGKPKQRRAACFCTGIVTVRLDLPSSAPLGI